MAEVQRISPAEARQKTRSGEAVLVCAYESDELCKRNRLEGSLSLKQFTLQGDQQNKEREIIFYCA